MRRLLIAILAAILATGAARAPAQPAVPFDHLPALKGGYFRHDSRILGRPLHIYVRLPADYAEQPERHYPIVYLLDGDSLFPILAAIHLFLTYDDGLPEAIVVGIAYGGFDPAVNRRDVDFTGPAEGAAPERAGAPAFQRMLREELLPEVERRWRADPARRILFGQSRGGSFVLYSAFTEPDLFWARIASNPAFEPGRARFFGAPPSATRRDLRLIVSSGTRDRPHLRATAVEWFRHWAGRGAPWTIRAQTIEGGTHAADAGTVYREALRWLFPAPPPATP
ncbi:MAG TPA: alpha/beta hydrolase-fold protein [Allosphingosinicella sp.]|nr:alpha/beta hydrolase-fold protein [Allosphingosinicella sp.]